jgi:hypothetical protein
MRDALNSNPLVQAAVIGVLLIGAAFFVISTSGGGGKEESGGGETEATVSVSGTTASGTASGATPGEAVEGAVEAAEQSASQSLSSALAAVAGAGAATPPLPHAVLDAWHANRTLVLLFVRDGGIDDRLTKLATAGVAGFPDVSLFVVPAHRISRYAAIAEGVGVDRVPALVVVTPRHLKRIVPTASVSYGFQSAASVRQAVIDAGYKGPTVDYHP